MDIINLVSKLSRFLDRFFFFYILSYFLLINFFILKNSDGCLVKQWRVVHALSDSSLPLNSFSVLASKIIENVLLLPVERFHSDCSDATVIHVFLQTE